ncbi:hypothetical protein BU24DRAFT_435817 [Aaosphaeria arxii CBS 175.79]|uniref:SH3 domain-containing protein n=1 Tax=Aaosphaeria arxii CBS 175.79 TaxID=1450172 RepID=A0A6A5XEI4_9PLEO|nr:uncharacterized protein BU24DRAFT_435817 [Aaosphaeria arxii CBS 175.79]KAF2011313.1 hypothetical protein BU24DRAFT_435817 [Aaosphaeria arxii CBS 175.79]
MTRPQIIRADTLDLQDKTSPTAQDHTRQPEQPAPLGVGPAAPHQEAALRNVNEERHSEEVRLQNGMANDASHDDRGNSQKDEQAVRLNGGMAGDNDDGDLQDAEEEEDMDDDMMDKISSSPSIDDGGYISYYSTASPDQVSPKTPNLRQSQDAANSPSSSLFSSSPFTATPLHFPISTSSATNSPDMLGSDQEIIPTLTSTVSFPIPDLSYVPPEPKKSQPTDYHHHHHGEYTGQPGSEPCDSNGALIYDASSPQTARFSMAEGQLQTPREESQVPLVSELDEDEVQSMLRPMRSPICDTFIDPDDEPTYAPKDLTNVEEPNNDDDPNNNNDDDDDDSGWTTDSDIDSFDESTSDETKGISFSSDPRYIDSGWGGECLRETEDIDFEFVYALHTFVATVEGQANATKGDTMVLLDDSNSYWWLVRVVKDSSIGYLPAEHIETPTERLARLNKHRNIDLSATMLGDTAEKSKNPLKKAMRRRNAKTVQFAAPTYVEASDYDYSSDEGDDGELFGGPDPTQNQTQAVAEDAQGDQDEKLKVQPLKVGGSKKEQTNSESESRTSSEEAAKAESEKRSSDEMFDRPLDPKVSRNGTMRNTDSFFKDDNAETRKITLTPNLLRDDSSTSTTGSRERGASLESLEKNGFADKVKDDKKKKEKKPGMLSGLFKRKDKKSKGSGALDSIDSDADGKQSEEFGRNSPQSKESMDGPVERPSTDQPVTSSPQRQPSKGKLQKPQRNRDDSPAKGILKTETSDSNLSQPVSQPASKKEAPDNKPSTVQPTSTMRLVSPEREEEPKAAIEERVQSPETRSRSNSAASKLNPINIIKGQQDGEPRPEKVKKAKQRVQLDDFDSEDDKNDPFADSNLAAADASRAGESDPTGRLSESPVHISAADAQSAEKEHGKEQEPDSQHPPGLTADTSSQETPSPVSTPTLEDGPSRDPSSKSEQSTIRAGASPSPTLLDPSSAGAPPSRPAPIPTKEMEDSSAPVSSESMSLPAWSDSSLRTYLDDGSDIRDMLVVINDTTGVVPVGPNHPIMSQLFVEESKAVTQLGGELDAMLNKWLEGKRQKQHGASPVSAKAGR